MDAKQLPHCQIIEFGEKHKTLIGDALQAVVNDMPKKHHPIATGQVLSLNSDTNDEVLQTFVKATKFHNPAASINGIKSTFTNMTQLPTVAHLLSDIGASRSFLTLTDMTQDALQVQEINIDALRGVDAVKELVDVQETKLKDVKVKYDIDFEEELAKLSEHVIMKNVETSKNSPTVTQHKDKDKAQNINLRDIEMFQELVNGQEIKVEDVKVEYQMEFEAEMPKLSEPVLLKNAETSTKYKTYFNENDNNICDLDMSTSLHTDTLYKGIDRTQNINKDAVRDIKILQELVNVQETEQIDVKLDDQMDFEAELAKLSEHVIMKNVETSSKYRTYLNEDYKHQCEPNVIAENSSTVTQHKNKAQNINLRDIEMFQELVNGQEIKLEDVKVEYQMEFKAELPNLTAPVLTKNVATSTKYKTYFNENDKNTCELDMSTSLHTDRTQNINKVAERDIKLLQESANVQETEQIDVKLDDQMDFEAELAKLSQPVLLKVQEKEIETIEDSNTNFNEDDDNYDTLPMPTPALKIKYMAKTTIDSLFLFICPECHYHSQSYDDWKYHTNELHQYNTVEKINLISVEGKFGFKCRKCSAPFSRAFYASEVAITHHITHLPFKQYIKCRLCEKSFSELRNAKRHVRLIHPDHCCTEQHKKQPNPLNYVSLHCPTCNMAQPNHGLWTEHMTLEHNFFEKCKQQFKHIMDDVYECKLCLKDCRKTAISDHVLTHEPYEPFQCTICSIQFRFKSFVQRAVVQHVRQEHIIKKNYINCNLCNTTFNSVVSLQNHLTRHHTLVNTNSYGSCQACNIEFDNLRQFLTHIHSESHNKNSKFGEFSGSQSPTQFSS